MLEDGAEVPRFRLPGTHDGEVDQFALKEYVGDAVVVLCFYQADFGPHCSPRDCWLQELDLLALQRNVTVLGVGPDTAYSHRAFADRANLDMPLLADTAGTAAEAFGVLDEFEGHRRVPRRAVFVVDDRGVVRYAWEAGERDERPDVDAVREAVRSVESDESALERYRRARDYYRYGESEFAIASEAFEERDWRLAVEAFEEAHRYFDDASEAADGAHWFAASEDLADDLRAAKSHVDHLTRAARWFADSARHYAEGDDERGDELRRDAARQRERAETAGSLPAPEALPVANRDREVEA
jgi:peroxiredoxin